MSESVDIEELTDTHAPRLTSDKTASTYVIDGGVPDGTEIEGGCCNFDHHWLSYQLIDSLGVQS